MDGFYSFRGMVLQVTVGLLLATTGRFGTFPGRNRMADIFRNFISGEKNPEIFFKRI